MSLRQSAGAGAILTFFGLSLSGAIAASDPNVRTNEMCVCASNQSGSDLGSSKTFADTCLNESRLLLSQANSAGNTEAGRAIIRSFAKHVKEVASCDINLATELAGLAVDAPDWVQVAFGAELDGTGTGAVGGKPKPIIVSAGSPS